MKPAWFKPILIFCLTLLWYFPASAQTILSGYVTLQNSGNQSAARAQVKSFGAYDTDVGAQDGYFELRFANKNPGADVSLEIVKPGYEVVNTTDLAARLSADPKARVRIFLCPEGDWRRYADEYYGTNQRNIYATYEKKLAELHQRFRGVSLENQAHRDALQQLAAERDAALALAEDFSEKLARTNLDFETDQYNKAFRLFTKGDLEGFFALLTEENISADMAKAEQAIARGEELVRIGRDKLVSAREAKSRIVEEFMIKARAHIIKFEWGLATRSYEIAVGADSTNFSNLFEVAIFANKQNKHKQAKNLFEKCLVLAPTPDERILVLNAFGVLLTDLNEYNAAKARFRQAAKTISQLWDNNPDESYTQQLAMVLANLGSIYYYEKDYSQAKENFEDAIKLLSEVGGVNVKKPLTWQFLASAHTNLGNLLGDIHEHDHAKTHYYEAISIYNDLMEQSQDDGSQYLEGMALALNNLGSLFAELEQLDSAKVYLMQALDIRQELSGQNPEAYLPQVAFSRMEMGNSLMHQRDYSAAKEELEKSLTIYWNLAGKDPAAWLPQLAGLYNSYGSLLKESGEFAQAKEQFDKALAILEVFMPSSVHYEHMMATILYNIGLTAYFGQDYASAKEHFEKALLAYKKMIPEKPEFAMPITARTCVDLARIALHDNDIPLAKTYYDEAIKTFEALSEKNPDAYLPKALETCSDFADSLNLRGNMSLAIPYYEKVVECYRLAASDDPDKPSEDIAVLYNELGDRFFELDMFDQALAYNQKALPIYQELARQNLANWALYLCNCLNNLGFIASKLGKQDLEFDYYTKTLAEASKAADKDPEEWFPILANAHHGLGDIEQMSGSFEAGIEHFEQAFLHYSALLQYDTLAWLQKTQHNAEHVYESFLRKKDHESASKYGEIVSQLIGRLIVQDPKSWLPDHVKYLHVLGYLNYQLGNYTAAKGYFNRAFPVYAQLADQDPEKYLPSYADCYNTFSGVYYALEMPDSAFACLQKSLDLLQQFTPDDPSKFEVKRARALVIQGNLLLNMGQKGQALESYKAAKKLAIKYPDSSEAVSLLRHIEEKSAAAKLKE